ncbi:MAG: translation initiation factor IF-6 [Candidatus Micrarchaeaceae archaeon]|jgi:translation initiation factor 6
MDAARYSIMGSDYVGVFATATDRFVFVGSNLTEHNKKILSDNLKAKCIDLSVSGSNLTGLFSKANSNGIIISNLIEDYELKNLQKQDMDNINIGVIDSNLNALGSNILANDKIAIINTDYTKDEAKQIGDILGVEVISAEIGNFKTVGANNILTNKGLAINNRSTDSDKEYIDKLTGFDSIRTTANVGSFAIGFCVVANSNAVVAGDSTTGYELARIVDALE